MTIQQFEYVLAVIKHGSFSRAADACFVTQPTLSAQISKLEQELGLVLIDRLARPVAPVPGAIEILRRAREAVQLFKSIPSLAAEESGTFEGEFKIGIIPTLGQYLVPLFLEGFMKDFCSLRLTVSELQSDSILDQVRDFRLDCGILALPTKSEGLDEVPLFLEEFLAYLPPGRESSERINVDSLKGEGLLLLNEGHCLRDQILEICASSRGEGASRLAFGTGSLESLKKLVDQGVGHTILPELSVADMDAARKTRVHPLGPIAPLRSIGLLSHPANSRPKLLGHLAKAIKEGLPPAVRNRRNGAVIAWRT